MLVLTLVLQSSVDPELAERYVAASGAERATHLAVAEAIFDLDVPILGSYHFLFNLEDPSVSGDDNRPPLSLGTGPGPASTGWRRKPIFARHARPPPIPCSRTLQAIGSLPPPSGALCTGTSWRLRPTPRRPR